MLTAWKIAMVLALPLMLGRRQLPLVERFYTRRVWTWAILMGASLLAAILPPFVKYWAVMDIIAALLVLSRRPAGCPQQVIGGIFAFMAVADVGYWIGGEAAPELFRQFMEVLGWVQFAALAAWGGYDLFFFRYRPGRSGADRRLAPRAAGMD